MSKSISAQGLLVLLLLITHKRFDSNTIPSQQCFDTIEANQVIVVMSNLLSSESVI